jgi:hypothetical protein
MTNKPVTGSIYRYPYLWRREGERGETEGRKNRPVCLAIQMEFRGQAILFFAPISTKEPMQGEVAIEIPELELQRAGLSNGRRGWIVLSEVNRDVLGKSFYFAATQKPIGRFSPKFLAAVLRSLLPALRRQGAMVDRI